VKVKKANKEKKPNPKLVEEIEDEKEARNGRGSAIYRVLNVDGLLRNTYNFLVFVGRSDLPKDKTTRQARIAELEKEVNEERAKFSKSDNSLIPLENELKGLILDKKEVAKVLKRKQALLTLLGGGTSATTVLNINGADRRLDSINVDIKDYGANLINPVQDTTHTTLDTALTYAEGFLSAIRVNLPSVELPVYATKIPSNYFNNRVYQTRRTLTDEGVGYGMLRALREFELSKLEAIIDTLTTTTGGVSKDDLKKYAKEIVEGSIH
jgi:hypothetical protein